MKKIFLFLLSTSLLMGGCQKKAESPQAVNTPKVVFKFVFDPTQPRLNNFGQPYPVPTGNAGQSPQFNLIGAHYFELTPTATTQFGNGQVLYQAPEVTSGGGKAIDFEQSILKAGNETYLEVPLSSIQAGSYAYLRVSLSYQNYAVKFNFQGNELSGTLASFVGFNTYLKDYTIKTKKVSVNANKLQGYWGFETDFSTNTGQAPATTVPNPIAATSPIPAGSCVVTGRFDTPLQITGSETQDIVITVRLSTNQSFEWKDGNANGKWDVDLNEEVVDMGIRGMQLTVEQ
ncbi:hypothetical protein [Microscilla marina]|uniref:Lipoprotein, putative n=1 Tax=Microscilla marina ATCC 23134 TaxID=313606 RepID=A1ZQ21_MICM2|nr:hypothetical protein [Microscilla marina]EAY27430.1 lipoprotein, putative [Microscilla marina ATCC 23134]